MKTRYTVDTTALISYFSDIFEVKNKMSEKAIEIINNAFLHDRNIITHTINSFC